MPAGVKFQKFAAYPYNGAVNLGSDTLKVMLTNTAPDFTNNGVYGDVSAGEVANGGGYTTGGITLTGVTSVQSGGLYKLIATGTPVWTGSGGGMGPFRYAIFYDSSASTKALIGSWDYGSSLTLAATNTFTLTLDVTNGILQNS
jgi:hypothetical protein